jgi:hypothetical protein
LHEQKGFQDGKALVNKEIQRDMVVSLLKGSSGAMAISELLRGLRNRDIDVDYNRFEDWVLDQEDMVRLSVDGRVCLQPGFNASHIRPSPIIPDLYSQEKDIGADTRLHRIFSYYIDCLRETGKSIFSYSEQQNSRFVTLDQELFSTSWGTSICK